MKKTGLILTTIGLSFGVAMASGIWSERNAAAQDSTYMPKFTSDGKLMRPEKPIWREWPFVGSLVTPNALNDGNAPFPEHHIIYIDPVSWAHYKKTGKFREGTVTAKELTRVRAPDGANKDG